MRRTRILESDSSWIAWQPHDSEVPQGDGRFEWPGSATGSCTSGTTSENERENEGIGVLHSTNVDRLMNTVFKKIARRAIEEVATRCLMEPKDISCRELFEGDEHEFVLD